MRGAPTGLPMYWKSKARLPVEAVSHALSALAGPVGALYSRWQPPAFFALLAAISAAAGVVMAYAAPRLQRLAMRAAGASSTEREKRLVSV